MSGLHHCAKSAVRDRCGERIEKSRSWSDCEDLVRPVTDSLISQNRETSRLFACVMEQLLAAANDGIALLLLLGQPALSRNRNDPDLRQKVARILRGDHLCTFSWNRECVSN